MGIKGYDLMTRTKTTGDDDSVKNKTIGYRFTFIGKERWCFKIVTKDVNVSVLCF